MDKCYTILPRYVCASPLCRTKQLFIVYSEFKKTSEGKIRIIGMKNDMKKRKKKKKEKERERIGMSEGRGVRIRRRNLLLA